MVNSGEAQSVSPIWMKTSNSVAINDFNVAASVANTSNGFTYTAQIIKPGKNGSISYKSDATNLVNGTKIFGLSPNTPYYQGAPLKYGILFNSVTSNIRTHIDGNSGAIIAYSIGDIITIKKESNVIRFLKNNVQFGQITCQADIEYIGDVQIVNANSFFEDIRIEFEETQLSSTVFEGTNYTLTTDRNGDSIYSKSNLSVPTTLKLDQVFLQEKCSSINIIYDKSKIKGSSISFNFDTLTETHIESNPLFNLQFNTITDSLSLAILGTKKFSGATTNQKIIQLEYCRSTLNLYINNTLLFSEYLIPPPPYNYCVKLNGSDSSFVNTSIISFANTSRHTVRIDQDFVNATLDNSIEFKEWDPNNNTEYYLGDSMIDYASMVNLIPEFETLDSAKFYNSVYYKNSNSALFKSPPGEYTLSVESENNTEKSFLNSSYKLSPKLMVSCQWDSINSVVSRTTSSGSFRFSTNNNLMTTVENGEIFFKSIFTNRGDIGAVVGFSVPDTTSKLDGTHIKYGFVIKDVALRVLHNGVQTNTDRVYKGGELGIKLENDSVYYISNGKVVYKDLALKNKILSPEIFLTNNRNRIKITHTNVSHHQQAVSKKQYYKVKHIDCSNGGLGEISLAFVNQQCTSPAYTLYSSSNLNTALASNQTGTFNNLAADSYTIKVVSSCQTYFLYADVGYSVDWNITGNNTSSYNSDPTSIQYEGTNSFSNIQPTNSDNNTNGANTGWFSFKTNFALQDILALWTSIESNDIGNDVGFFFLNNFRMVYAIGPNGTPAYSASPITSGSAWRSYKFKWQNNIITFFENGIQIYQSPYAFNTDINNFFARFAAAGENVFITECYASFDCESITQRVRVNRSLNTEDYLLLAGDLKIAYTEDYQPSNGTASYKIYKSELFPYSPELFGNVSVSKGMNNLTINCASLSSDSYILVIENDKSEKYFLRFWKS
jgi:hypothetical protein